MSNLFGSCSCICSVVKCACGDKLCHSCYTYLYACVSYRQYGWSLYLVVQYIFMMCIARVVTVILYLPPPFRG